MTAWWWLIYRSGLWLWCPRYYLCIRTRQILKLFIGWRFGQSICSDLSLFVCRCSSIVLCFCPMVGLRFVRLIIYTSWCIVWWDVACDPLAFIIKLFQIIIWKLIIEFSSLLLLNIKGLILAITCLLHIFQRLRSFILPLYLMIPLFCGTSGIVSAHLSYLLMY